jgi:hypothetical protein
VDVGLDHLDAQPVHHLQRGRHHPGGDDGAHCRRPVGDLGEVHQHRAHGGRVGGEAHAHLRGDAEHALAADERAAQVVAVGFGFLAAQNGDRAVGEDHLGTEDVRRGDTVGQAVRPAAVVGQVAADRTALLAARVRGEVQAELVRHVTGEVEVQHAGLHPGERFSTSTDRCGSSSSSRSRPHPRAVSLPRPDPCPRHGPRTAPGADWPPGRSGAPRRWTSGSRPPRARRSCSRHRGGTGRAPTGRCGPVRGPTPDGGRRPGAS